MTNRTIGTIRQAQKEVLQLGYVWEDQEESVINNIEAAAEILNRKEICQLVRDLVELGQIR